MLPRANLVKQFSTHAARLERWLGSEMVSYLRLASQNFYYPLSVANVPGDIRAYKGDFFGAIRGGAGFASLSDLLNESSKKQSLHIYKQFQQSAPGSLWHIANYSPPAAGNATAIPGGDVPTNTTTGALPLVDPSGSDTTWYKTAYLWLTGNAPNVFLLYDRIFEAGSVQHNTTGNQAVTGVPTRYATTTAPGNFAFLEVTTGLGATASNLTMTYTDDQGNSPEAAPAIAINASQVSRMPHSSSWFIPLNANDIGLRTVTNIAFSAVSSGVSDVVMGHPIALIPVYNNNEIFSPDGVNSNFDLVQIQTGAALTMIYLLNGNSNMQGQVEVITG